jgi:hypothetical protein
MAYLHLPEQHSTDDLVLAGQIAEAFASEELFVTWTEQEGPGARPTVEAVVRDAPPNPLIEAIQILASTIAGAWRALTRPAPAPRAEQPAAGERQAA